MEDLTNEIEKALDLLTKVYKEPSNTKKLLIEKGRTVYLQVVLFKSPFTCPRKRKFLTLRHSLYGSDPEICLFVPNRKTGVEYKKTTDELIDFCVDYYSNLLEKHKIKGITTVMPLKQLKSEYGTYELRRRLVNRFDLFLCKNSLLYNSRFLTSLGKIFTLARKEPLGVSFPKEDVDYDPEFHKNIERAIFTSSFYINRFSDNYSIPFGCLSNTKQELKENLEAVLNQLFKEKIIPGGIKNIRALYLWPSQLKPVPLFINPELPVNLKIPNVKSKRKRAEAVEGELSCQPHKKVFVMTNGEVFVTENKNSTQQDIINDSEGEDSFKDESDAEDEEEEKRENSNSKDKALGKERESESESEDDEEIEEKEARLLEVKKRIESHDYPEIKTVQNAKEESERENRMNKTQKKKLARKGTNKFNIEKESLLEKTKFEKTKGNRNKVNKSKRKMLIKEGKFNSVGGTIEKGKLKKKKILQ